MVAVSSRSYVIVETAKASNCSGEASSVVKLEGELNLHAYSGRLRILGHCVNRRVAADGGGGEESGIWRGKWR
jgi:hypothetical protein